MRSCVCAFVRACVCVENLTIPLQTSTRVPMNVKRLIRVVKKIKRDKILEVVALSMYLDSQTRGSLIPGLPRPPQAICCSSEAATKKPRD